MAISKYDQLRAYLLQSGEPEYRYRQIIKAIFRKRTGEFQLMTTLPLNLRFLIIREFSPSILGLTPVVQTESQQAQKILFQLSDTERIETVRLKYRGGWDSLCISSQCGCGLACEFCATGTITLRRNLTADEITDQVLFFHLRGRNIDSISLMGMGEPLANPELFTALRLFTSPELFNLSPSRISISTVGVIPAIKRLSESYPRINLVF